MNVAADEKLESVFSQDQHFILPGWLHDPISSYPEYGRRATVLEESSPGSSHTEIHHHCPYGDDPSAVSTASL